MAVSRSLAPPGASTARACCRSHRRTLALPSTGTRHDPAQDHVHERTAATAGGRRGLPGDEWSALLRIGVPRETKPRETRVAATPATVTKLVALGYEVAVETGAGHASSFLDRAYAAAGASIGTADEAWQADVVLRVNAPTPEELPRLRDGATLISLLAP